MTYEFSLEGKTTLITAAGQGIGRASAEAFAKAGASVIATDINETALAELEGLDGITAWKLDATNPEDIKRVLAEAGRLDVLFNCAGFVHAGNILESTEEDWDFAFDLNAKAMYRLCKAVLPGMLEQGKGSIINMSSVASSLKGVPNRFVYCASKAAVIGMTKAIAADYVTASGVPNMDDGNQIMWQLLQEDIVESPDLSPKDGKIQVMSGLGLGFSLNDDAVSRAAEEYRKTKYLELHDG